MSEVSIRSQRAVSRILSRPGPLRARAGDDHSSSLAIAGEIKRPTRKLRTGRPQTLPYLVLLRAGFCLPPVLPRARCALTAPFHPYSPSPGGPGYGAASLEGLPRRSASARKRAVYFLCHYPSGCPDRGLPGALPCGVRTFLCLTWTGPKGLHRTSSDRLARCEPLIVLRGQDRRPTPAYPAHPAHPAHPAYPAHPAGPARSIRPSPA
jgi:hypothetical protein